MDYDLFLILFFFWSATTSALIGFFIMWYYNRGEAFHPHSVDMADPHQTFSVVSGPTICKYDFSVKSISAYASVRGSTSSKQFGTLSCLTAMSGLMGVYRWTMIGDCKPGRYQQPLPNASHLITSHHILSHVEISATYIIYFLL